MVSIEEVGQLCSEEHAYVLHDICMFGRSNRQAIFSWSQQANRSFDWGTIGKITCKIFLLAVIIVRELVAHQGTVKLGKVGKFSPYGNRQWI